MPATLSHQQFMAQRVSQVGGIVSILRGDVQKGRPVHGLLPTQGKLYVIATHDELNDDKGNFRDARLKSFVDTYWFQYFEMWQPTHRNEDILRLYRAYLTVFRINPETHQKEEHVCLHCDPFEEVEINANDKRTVRQKKRACQFKQSPHLHIKCSNDLTLPHSHFPLNLGHLQAVLSTTKTLTIEIRRAAEVLRDEVLFLSLRKEHLLKIC